MFVKIVNLLNNGQKYCKLVYNVLIVQGEIYVGSRL